MLIGTAAAQQLVDKDYQVVLGVLKSLRGRISYVDDQIMGRTRFYATAVVACASGAELTARGIF